MRSFFLVLKKLWFFKTLKILTRFEMIIQMQSFLSLDSTAGETFAYKPQGSRFEAKFPQLSLWVVQLV